MMTQYEATASAEQVRVSVEKTNMKKITQARPVGHLNIRTISVLGLLVLGLLFAPLGQGLGLSAGQGLTQETGASAAANVLAAHEVEKLTGLK